MKFGPLQQDEWSVERNGEGPNGSFFWMAEGKRWEVILSDRLDSSGRYRLVFIMDHANLNKAIRPALAAPTILAPALGMCVVQILTKLEGTAEFEDVVAVMKRLAAYGTAGKWEGRCFFIDDAALKELIKHEVQA